MQQQTEAVEESASSAASQISDLDPYTEAKKPILRVGRGHPVYPNYSRPGIFYYLKEVEGLGWVAGEEATDLMLHDTVERLEDLSEELSSFVVAMEITNSGINLYMKRPHANGNGHCGHMLH